MNSIIVCLIAFVAPSRGLRLSSRQASMTATQPFNDSRLPFLHNIDYSRLYCFDSSSSSAFVDLASESSSGITTSTSTGTVACKTNSDCSGATPFCLSGFCRECRYASDCPSASQFQWTSTHCALSSNYVCSECLTDADCTNSGSSGQLCRTVFDSLGLSRKRCVACSGVPPDAAMKSTTTCDWFCQQANSMIGADGKCSPCPTCNNGEMLVPTEDFALTEPNYFFPTCNMATNPKCVACPGASNPCADILSPTGSWTGVAGVGQLAPAYACGTFKCKTDWWLDSNINQCRRCDYRSCPAGQKLVGCGVASPGTCQPCSQSLPTGFSFISPKDMTYQVNTADDVCKPQCNADQTLVRANSSSPWVCTQCAHDDTCSPGYFFSGCSGPTPGQCLPCAPAPLPGTYWSGPGCDVTVCNPNDCQAGQALTGCGGSSAGQCQACPAALPANAAGYVAIYDEQTGTKDTCGVKCADGYFVRRVNTTTPSGTGNTVSAYECVKCDSAVCQTGQQLIGCGGDQPGKCGSCPAPNPGLYLAPSVADPCSSQACPADSSQCPAGQKFSDCGGSNPGACTSCGTLPVGASGWIQSMAGSSASCDITCQDNYFKNVSFSGLVRNCVSCTTLASSSCPVGQQLVGCSNSSPGACQACPTINATTYWTGKAGCDTGDCTARGCAADEMAYGCGLANAGTCTKCSAIKSLPIFASSWTVIKNKCVPVCQAGYYRTAVDTCEACSVSVCGTGKFLANCGGTSPGSCMACNAAPSGQCHSGFGLKLGDPDSCPTNSC